MNTLRSARANFVLLALLLTAVGVFWSAPAAAQQDFYTVPPCRIADTRDLLPGGSRNPDTNTGTPLVNGIPRSFQVAGVCGIPSNAKGVSVMLVAVNSTLQGNIVIYEDGTATPNTSNVNFRAGENRANNMAFVTLSANGKFTALARLNAAGEKVHFVVDVAGYLLDAQPPVAVNDNYAAERDTVLNVAVSGVLSNDTLNLGAILSYGATTGSEQTTLGTATPTSQGGSVTLYADGHFDYTPPTGAVGIDDTFKYVLQNVVGTSTATVTIAVGKTAQTISFTSTAPAGAKVGGSTYTVTATATSGLPVTFSIDASAASVCSIAGSTVSFIGVGTCVINANQTGDTNYAPAPQVQQSFLVAKGDQTITFTSAAPAGATVGGPTYNVTATATSGLPVTFAIDASAASVCTIAGSTVSFIGVGTCVVNANQAGDANWNAAPQVQQPFVVGKGDQTITFTSTAPTDATVNGPTYTVTATASSGLPVTFSIDPSATSVCSIAGSTVSFTAAGTCVINANQAGDVNYNAAPQAQQSFPVSLDDQTISFTSTPPSNAKVGDPAYNVTATATSGLTVTFTIDASATSVCSIAGSAVSFIGVGNCVINANQAGDASYSAAPQVQQSIPVAKGDQTITLTSTAPVNAKVGGPTYNVTATASSGLAVTFTIAPSASAICTIAGSTVSFIGVGTCLVNANQPGDANWNAAPQVQQSFSVAKGDQTISFTSTAPVNAKVGGSTYNVTATATSGLPVTFTIDAPATSVCTIAGSTVSFIGAGTCVINANQAGNVNYNAAPQVQQSFTVSKGDQTISFTSTAPVGAKVGGPTYNVTATATSGLAVTFTIDPSASTVCTIAGSTVSFIGAGTCVINANQAGDANWNAAPQVQQSVAVAKGDQTITFNSTAPTQAKVGGSTYTVTATASSGLPVTFTIDASASTVCTIAGSTVSFIGSGTCVINANQAGNANYNAAPQVQQSFVVYQSPVITSANSTNFLATDPGTFTVTTIGFPSGASMVISETGALPNGVTFTNNNNGTATLAGTPAAGTQGDYSIVITADNGIAPAASQNFTLHVLNHAPQLTTNSVTYTTPGNTQLHVAGAILPGVASWADASGLLSKSGATDPDGPAALTVVPASGLTANGGSYSILADGRFTYVPAAGFTGTDTFSFGVTDTLDTTPGTINITVGTRVWYIRDVIDAQNAAGGDGRSTNPFDNIAAFNAATTNNGDIIFIFEGNTGTTPLTGSITLKDGQKLWGQGIALNVPSFGTSLVNAANKPRIRTTTASTDVVSVPATAGSRSNVEIRGLDLEATGVTSNAIDVTASGANTVGITISNNNFRGSTAEGIDLNAGGTAAFTATIQSNTITSAGNGIDTRVSATGTTTVMASNNMITSTAGNAFDARTLAGASALRVSLDSMNVAAAGTGILIDGSAAGTTTITSFSGNTVDGATVGTGISITSAIFDGTPGGTFQPFTAGNLSVGSGINSVGGPGVVLTNVQGDLSFTNLNIYAGGGAGLRVSSTTAYTGSAGLQLVVGAGGSNVEATNGPAVDVTQATVTLPFLSIKSTNSPTTGVALNSVAGTFSAGSGSSISGTSGTGFQVGSSSANVSYDGTITTTAGKGVDLTSNSGTIGFTGALTLSSGANTAFNATGGGTVTSTNTSSTLTSTTGTALNVANTTIGAGGLKFRSISAGTGASGPVSGIILNTTGSSGGLTVSGSGSAGSGGTIQRTTGPGISLTSTSNVSLSWMNVQNGGDDGIRGSNVTGFTLDRSTLSANGNAAGESGLDFAGLFGTASITNSTITGSAEDNAVIRNSSGTLSSLTVTGSTFSSNSSIGNDGLLIDLTGTANVTASVSSSTFTANRGDHFQGTAANSAVLNVTFSGNTLTGGHATALGQGITINAATAVPGFSGAVTYTLSNNSINGAILNAIQTNLGTSAAGATMSGTISNNVIGTAGSFQSCSTQGSGIGIDAHGNGTHTVVVSGNTIRQCFDRGITVLANDGSGTLNLTVTGNNSSHSDGTNSREGFFLNAGSADPNIFGVADAHFVCLNLGGAGALSNTLTHGPGASDDFRIRQRFSTTVRLPGYAGSATDTAAVVSYVLSRNSATAGSATVSSPPGGGFVGGVACPLP